MAFELKALENFTRDEKIDFLFDYIKALLKTESDREAIFANISSIIMATINDLNWVGFYIYKEKELVLGPFQGLPACTRLSLDSGVCAKSFREKRTIRVDNVHEFIDHIACDSNSNSELVVPIIKDEKVIAVLDLDSPTLKRFTTDDEKIFEKLVKMIEATL